MSGIIRVLLTRRFMPEDMEYLKTRLNPGVQLVMPESFGADALGELAASGIDAMLGEPPGKEVLDRAKGLRLIQVPWTGVERLDRRLLKEYSFAVCNSHSNARTVAEHALALLLAAAKWIPYHDRHMRKGKWCRPNLGEASLFRPSESLYGKTLGIVGYGAIGRALARMTDGLGMIIQAVDAKSISQTPAPLTRLVAPQCLDEVAAAADFLVVAVPLVEETRAMIDRDVFDRMKSTAIFVSVSRGEVVVEEDLYRVLSECRIAGAAIDTWYQYPKSETPNVFPSLRFPFHELENLILSPHRAGFARGELPHLDDAIENLNRLAAGKELHNVVNLSAGY